MKYSLSWMLVGLLVVGSSGCIYVHVKGDLRDDFWNDDGGGDEVGFKDLSQAIDGHLADPKYELQLTDTLLGAEYTWTVGFAEAGSDPGTAFHHVQDAVRQRIEARGGHVVSETNDETSGESAAQFRWSCKFHRANESGETEVRVQPRSGDEHRSRELVLHWKGSD